MSYEGQPGYVLAGFQRDLYEHWVMALPNDEWSREIEAMWSLVSAMMSGSDYVRATVVCEWIREELTQWAEEDWLGDFAERPGVRAAQDEFERIVELWRDRAKGFNGAGTTNSSDALKEFVVHLPSFFRPDPDAEPLPDPERATYERLKAKFEFDR